MPPYSTGSFDTNRRGQDAALFAALIAADSALAAASTAALADKRQRRRMSVLFPSARFVVDLALPETVPLLRRLHFGERNCKANCRSSSNTNNGAFDTTPGSGLSGVVSAVAVDRLLALACCQPTVLLSQLCCSLSMLLILLMELPSGFLNWLFGCLLLFG